MKNLSKDLSGFIGEASSMVTRTDINKIFNRLVPESKMERLLMAFGPEVAAEAPYIWNDMLDSFTLALSNLVDVQGSVASKAKRRVRSGVIGQGASVNLSQREDVSED